MNRAMRREAMRMMRRKPRTAKLPNVQNGRKVATTASRMKKKRGRNS